MAARNRGPIQLNRNVRFGVRNDAVVIVGQCDVRSDHVDEDGSTLVEGLLESANAVVERIDTVAVTMDTLSTAPIVDLAPVDLSRVLEEGAAKLRDHHAVDLPVDYRGARRRTTSPPRRRCPRCSASTARTRWSTRTARPRR